MTVSGHASPTAIYAVIFTATGFAIIAVAVRLYTRLKIVRRIWWDDILMTLAIFFTCIYTAVIAVETHFGLGRHQASLTTEQISNRLLCFWLSVFFYQIGIGLAKVSIIAQCIRVFESVRKFCYVAGFLGLIVIAYTITTCFVTLFMCKPISYFWHPERTGHCLTARPIWFFNTTFSIATDIAVALLPLPVVNTLHLPKRQKQMLMAVFALGGSVCLISLIRLYSLYAVTHNHDDTWEDPQASVYSSIETLVAIIAGCLPTYNAFLAKHFPGLHQRYAMHRNVTPVLPSLDIDAAFPVDQSPPRADSAAKDMVTGESGSADETTIKSGHISREMTVDLTALRNETESPSWRRTDQDCEKEWLEVKQDDDSIVTAGRRPS